MKKQDQQQGFTLIVIMIAICIIAVLFWIGPFSGDSSKKNSNAVDTVKTYKKAQSDLGDIQKRLQDRDAQTMATSTE